MTSAIKQGGIACAVLILSTTTLVLWAGWMLARPAQMAIGEAPPELNAQPVKFPSASGATVHGWWCQVQDNRGVALLLPGKRANRVSMVDRARFLRRANYSVLLIDFQGTGETKGSHITFGWKERCDVLAAAAFIREKEPSSHVSVIGESLGAAAALLATPPLKVDGLILESVYPTIEIAIRNRLRNHFGSLGQLAEPLLLDQLPLWLGISANDLRPIDHIANVHCPILIISGEKDRSTTPEEARLLFSHAQSPKELWLIPQAGHADLYQAIPKEYESHVLAFLKQI